MGDHGTQEGRRDELRFCLCNFGQGVIVNVAESEAVGSKTEVAVTVTEVSNGTVGGALYWTELVVWSVSVPAPVMLQVTPRFIPV